MAMRSAIIPLAQYAKRLRFSPAFAVADQDVWFVRFQNQPPIHQVPVIFRLENVGRMFGNRPAG